MQISNHRNKIHCIAISNGWTTEQHSYLGVQLHHKLLWEAHIDYICSKAIRALGFLQRNLNGWNVLSPR